MNAEIKVEGNTIYQYLTFKLGGESYAIEIARVREVLDYTNTTKIPRTPKFMVGVINLRGNIVPVVDLRQTLGMTPSEIGNETCIVITEIDASKELLVVGALADSVQEVMEISEDAIGATPRIGAKLKTEYLKGIGKQNDDFVMILDVDKVFNFDELEIVEKAAGIVPDSSFAEVAQEAQTPWGSREGSRGQV